MIRGEVKEQLGKLFCLIDEKYDIRFREDADYDEGLDYDFEEIVDDIVNFIDKAREK